MSLIHGFLLPQNELLQNFMRGRENEVFQKTIQILNEFKAERFCLDQTDEKKITIYILTGNTHCFETNFKDDKVHITFSWNVNLNGSVQFRSSSETLMLNTKISDPICKINEIKIMNNRKCFQFFLI
jgi:hypothetical protein